MKWRPEQSITRNLLLVLPLLSLVLAGWLWGRLAERAGAVGYDLGVFLFGIALFLSLFLAGMLLYIAWCAFTISYRLDSSTLTIAAGGLRHLVPLRSITEVYGPGDAAGDRSILVRWRGSSGLLPGYLVGEGQSEQIGKVIAVSSAPASAQVFIVTPGATFGISPQNAGRFLKALEERRNASRAGSPSSAPHDEAPRTELHGFSRWGLPLWSDPLVRWLVIGGLVLCALFFAYLGLVYNQLPSRLALHWNAQGQVDRIGDPSELARLPVFGLLVWLANVLAGWWALNRERAATFFLLGGAAAAQLVFAAGALSIVLRAT